MSKLALGTVQFGLNYGVSNSQGKVSTAEVKKILALAKSASITLLDTAPAYGNSEQVLGKISYTQSFDIVSKIPPNCAVDDFYTQVNSSLNHLKKSPLYGLLLHHGEVLFSEQSATIYQQITRLKTQKNITQKIGCSLYSPKQAVILSKQFKLDIIQLPASIFDQRILTPNILMQLKAQGVEIHLRSLFLQGALFIAPNELPKHLQALKPILTKIRALVGNNKQDLIAYALAPFVQNKYIHKIVIGCCSAQELTEIIAAYQQAKTLTLPYQFCAITDEKIILPRYWPTEN